MGGLCGRPVVSAFAAAVIALCATAAASAATVVVDDAAGRKIHFDVQAEGVDVEAYARVLRASAHGDEISQVTVEIVPPDQLAKRCGSGAAACYWRGFGWSTIVMPGTPTLRRALLLHEYGHHIDHTYGVDGVAEPNGTPGWWALRGKALVDAGQAVGDYGKGWSRSIGEVFAEDYAYAHSPTPFQIPWLGPPEAAVRAALLAEVGGTSVLAPTETVLQRSGRVGPRRRASIVFEVAAGGRVATATLTVSRRSAATVEVDCGPGRRAGGDFAARVEVPSGTTACVGTVANRTRGPLVYTLRVVASTS